MSFVCYFVVVCFNWFNFVLLCTMNTKNVCLVALDPIDLNSWNILQNIFFCVPQKKLSWRGWVTDEEHSFNQSFTVIQATNQPINQSVFQSCLACSLHESHRLQLRTVTWHKEYFWINGLHKDNNIHNHHHHHYGHKAHYCHKGLYTHSIHVLYRWNGGSRSSVCGLTASVITVNGTCWHQV